MTAPCPVCERDLCRCGWPRRAVLLVESLELQLEAEQEKATKCAHCKREMKHGSASCAAPHGPFCGRCTDEWTCPDCGAVVIADAPAPRVSHAE